MPNQKEKSNRKGKLARVRDSGHLRVLDLFAGCGGMSLGFAREQFSIVGAVELDPLASLSHALNFHRHDDQRTRDRHRQARDITVTNPDDLAQELSLGETSSVVDVIVGGPPCQSYARVGRAKLREVYEHPRAFKIDPRGNLYLRYLEYVRQFQPLAVVMENVPDVLNNGGHYVAEEGERNGLG